MIAGKDAFRTVEAKNSWLTGTASWNYAAITQYILGIRPDYDGLRVDPCIPAGWKEYKVIRTFRGREFTITIKNPAGVQKGVDSIRLNGKRIQGNVVPIEDTLEKNDVVVVLGK